MSNYLRKMLNRPKFILIFLQKYQDSLQEISRKTIKENSKLIGKGKGKYIVNINEPSFISDNKRFYFINNETGAQFTFKENNRNLKPDELDIILGNNILTQLTRGAINDKKRDLMLLGVGFVCGILLGLLIMSYIMQNKVNEIYKEWSTTYNPFG